MSDTESRPPDHQAGAPGPAPGTDVEPEVRALETAFLRRGVWLLPIGSIVFLAAVWGIQKTVFETAPAAAPALAPAHARDVSLPVKRLYQVAHGAGARLHVGADRQAMAAWLAERIGTHGAVPDLAGAGLEPAGVRELNLGEGWGMVDYREPDGAGGVIAVLAPQDAVRVPAEAVGRAVGGAEVWVLMDGDLHLAWVPGRGADWVLASERDEAALLAVAGSLLAGLP